MRKFKTTLVQYIAQGFCHVNIFTCFSEVQIIKQLPEGFADTDLHFEIDENHSCRMFGDKCT